MVIKLSEYYYSLAKTIDFTDLGDYIRFNDENDSIELDNEPIVMEDYFGNKFTKSPIQALLGCIEDEVVLTGLSQDQNRIKPRGRDLYDLHDSIYFSLPVKGD